MAGRRCAYCGLPIERGKMHPECRREAEAFGVKIFGSDIAHDLSTKRQESVVGTQEAD